MAPIPDTLEEIGPASDGVWQGPVRPGQPVPSSASGRPIMVAMHLLSGRWVLRILWELRGGALGFRKLQARCEQMSPTTLSSRLSELKAAGIVEHDAAGDGTLTALGRDLGPALRALQRWADAWAESLDTQAIKKGDPEP